MMTFFKRTGWKVLLLLVAAAAVPACADRETRKEPSSGHGTQSPSGPMPSP